MTKNGRRCYDCGKRLWFRRAVCARCTAIDYKEDAKLRRRRWRARRRSSRGRR